MAPDVSCSLGQHTHPVNLSKAALDLAPISWLVAGLYLVSSALALCCALRARRHLFACLSLGGISLVLAADEVWNLHRILSAAVRAATPFSASVRLLLWLGLGAVAVLAAARIVRSLAASAGAWAKMLLTLWLAALLLLLWARSADIAMARAGIRLRTGNLGAAAKMVAALSLAGALTFCFRSRLEREEVER